MSKVLVSRIKPFLNHLISEDQYAFIKGRHIGESVRLIDDILQINKQFSIPGILCCADFETAFDSLDHTFIFTCMEHFGFPAGFIRWVKLLHTEVESCVLNNRYSTGCFNIERGTRHFHYNF